MTRTTADWRSSIAVATVAALLVPARAARRTRTTLADVPETNETRIRHIVGRLDRARLTDEAPATPERWPAAGAVPLVGPEPLRGALLGLGRERGLDERRRRRPAAGLHGQPHAPQPRARPGLRAVAVGAATDDRGRLYVTVFFCT